MISNSSSAAVASRMAMIMLATSWITKCGRRYIGNREMIRFTSLRAVFYGIYCTKEILRLTYSPLIVVLRQLPFLVQKASLFMDEKEHHSVAGCWHCFPAYPFGQMQTCCPVAAICMFPPLTQFNANASEGRSPNRTSDMIRAMV
jgi:hypothetical protein